MFYHRMIFLSCMLLIGFYGSYTAFASEIISPEYPQPEKPAFWKSKVQEIEQAVKKVEKGKTKIIAISAGGRPVYLVQYGPDLEFEHQANYNSAAAARNPGYYARKTDDISATVFLVGTPHGHEVEAMAGIVNLLNVAETGKDLRGKSWPRLYENLHLCEALIVPLANPDGRARCPYDSFVGIPVNEMTRVGQGTRKDGTLYGWPGAKQRHPMVGDVGILGAYFNDNGINLMHDDWFAPMAEETEALLRIAREEAPDYILNLHSHGSNPVILSTKYVPWYCKEIEFRFGQRLMARYTEKGLPAGNSPKPSVDGEKYPPPSFNLTSALHHCCGGVSMLFECPHGLKETKYPQVDHDQILDIQLMLYEELFSFAAEFPRPQSVLAND